ncbi:extracellular fatty acid-binding protein [Manacus vitellinus]|uniref:extracellular fatty acid-binding protein n=1 Tax=Manacus vitellinus TaxID=328815 RepID=UPI0008474B1B|nr:extracellular fatty acid-binding protein [Manacus vitellinus]XP_051664015.1 extracellular fatty acid-binding protein-like [Manacus candei]
MRTVGLSLGLGLALICLLHVEAEDLGAGELDTSKIAGKWYITAMASDSESYLQRKDQLKMAMAGIEVLGKDLKVSFAIPTPERCMKFESIYKPTSIPGEYYSSDRGNKTAQLVDTDGRTYVIIFATREKEGKILHMLRLYSRTRWVRPRITDLFKTFAKMEGFSDEMIWILPRQDECRLDGP